LKALRTPAPHHALRRISPAIAGILVLICCGPASAQSWLPLKGSFGYGLDYNDTFNKHHYDSRGNRVDAGHTRIFSATLTAAYSPSDRWLLIAGLPYVEGEYHGDHPHPTSIDNSQYHGTVTDARIEAHYQLIDNGTFALAPMVAAVVPVHDYETMGHAAPGRGLNEAWVGTFIGASLDEWLPRTYLQLRLNYAFVEKVAGVKHDRINADAEIGYFLSSKWSVRLIGNWQDTDGGINVPVPPDDDLFPHHDQLAAARFFNLGGGLAWTVSDSVRTYLIYSTALHGRNAHMQDRSFTFGMSYSGAR